MWPQCLRYEQSDAYLLSVRPNGTAIRAIRKAQKMSIRELSSRTKLHRGYLSHLERGHIREPADAKLDAITEALGVSHDAITHKENP